MSPVEVLAYVDRSGGRVWLEGGRLRYRLPEGRADVLETLKANRDQVIGFLERTFTTQINTRSPLPRLPHHLEALIRAASSGVLPVGTIKLESGIVSDFERYVLAWAASYLTGAGQDAITRLEAAHMAWTQDREMN